MRFTLTIAATLALASPAFSAVVHAQRRSAPGLDISLSQISNSELKAVVTNTGDEEVSLLHYNFFNDKAPVKKVSVFRDDAEVQFTGILRRYASANLSSEVFTILAPGASFEDTVDIASTADLSIGGKFTVSSTGAVPYAIAGSSEISGYIPFKSNDLVVEVDGAVASKVAQAVVPLDRRSRIASCSGTRATALRTALSNTVSLANAAANAAASGSSTKFTEYFKSTSYRSTVAARLRAVASEASSTTSGSTTYYCTDPYGYCDTNVLAWTLPSQNVIANCDIYYTYLSALTGTCHAQDQATTTLHELTHAPGVYSPGTDDNGYGYAAATALSGAQAVLNADSYALYANAIYVGC